ncbi:MAG: family 1 glycosylhydrolase, partial [Bryobacteraceae bacterium]|nr:family 1 glycosylhydrolase [Bryobacteraceae bacterium]
MSDFLKVLSRPDRPGNDKRAASVAPAPPGQSEDVERYRTLVRHDNWRFAFATGIECSNPVITGKEGLSVRRDQLAECYHYRRFKEDLYLTRELGLDVLRYGLPYHLVNPARDRYDWGFADEAMGEILRLGITPILDLLHFGVPDWLGDFQNPELPVCFAEYAGRVAERY